MRYGLEIISYRNPYLYANLPKECMVPNFLSKFTEKNKEPDMWGICMLIMGYLQTKFLLYLNFSTYKKKVFLAYE